MKKVYSNSGIKTVTAISVSVEFSREIAYWGSCYYENPRFVEFWDKRNGNSKYKDNLWRVFYCTLKSEERAYQGELEGNTIRILSTIQGDQNIMIRPSMHFILMHSPSEFPTTFEVGLYDFAMLCRDCAKYCGGTVEITYSKKQHRFIWDEVETTTITLGKGIRKWRVKEPKASKRGKECEHTWQSKEDEE